MGDDLFARPLRVESAKARSLPVFFPLLHVSAMPDLLPAQLGQELSPTVLLGDSAGASHTLSRVSPRGCCNFFFVRPSPHALNQPKNTRMSLVDRAPQAISFA